MIIIFLLAEKHCENILTRTIHGNQKDHSYHTLCSVTTMFESWKKTYKEVIEKWWLKTLRQKADTMSSLSYLNKNACSVGTVHPVWKYGSDPLQSLMASTKAKLLVQRYPLTTSHTAGKINLTCAHSATMHRRIWNTSLSIAQP